MQVSLPTANAKPNMLRNLSKLSRSRLVDALPTRNLTTSVRAAQQEAGSAAARRSGDVPVRQSGGRPRQTAVTRPYNRTGSMSPFSLTSGLAPVLPTRFDSLFRYINSIINCLEYFCVGSSALLGRGR